MTSTNTKSPKLELYLLLLVCGLSLLLGLVRGASIPFWSDEISTIRIAEMPTWKATFEATQTLDLNPPLEVFLVRASSLLLGWHELAGRLPSILGFTLAAGCLFVFLRRRVSPWFAAFGSLLLLQNSEAFYFATEARPYALLLGMLGVTLIAYDCLLDSGTRTFWPRVWLFLGMAGMIVTHVFSVFAVLAFFFAELIRTKRRRRLDAVTWAALLLPLLFCVLYRPLFQSHGSLVYPSSQRVHLMPAFRVYLYLFLVPVARVLAATLLVLLVRRAYPETNFLSWLKMPVEKWALLLVILSTPVSVAILLMVKAPTSGYYTRYGLALFYPALFLVVSWIAWRSRESVRLAQLFTGFVLVAMFFTYHEIPAQVRALMHHGWRNAPTESASTGGVNLIHPELPLVANDGLEFLEADNRLSSADLARFYYLTDPTIALRISEQNVLEGLQSLREPFHIRGNVEPLQTFSAVHDDFLVIGDFDRSTSWLLRWAMEQGADIRYLGRYTFAGEKMPLWRVTLK